MTSTSGFVYTSHGEPDSNSFGSVLSYPCTLILYFSGLFLFERLFEGDTFLGEETSFTAEGTESATGIFLYAWKVFSGGDGVDVGYLRVR